MKAAVFTKTGPPNVIEVVDLPTPEPGECEVRIELGAASVNPIDTYIRSGAVPLPVQNPQIIGCDFAGTVTKVGSAVERFRPGDRVWGSNQTFFGRQGTFAEQIVVDEQWCNATPEGETDTEAAAGALVGITAHLGLHRTGQLQPGDSVFVNGGTGGVGSSVVQLAKATGAVVATTAGSPEKLERCRDLGADIAFDYRSHDLDEQIRAFLEQSERSGFDLWYETLRQPTLERTIGMMAEGGRIILMAGRDARPEFPLGSFYTQDLSIRGFAMFKASADEQRVCGEAINRLYEAGSWKPQIGTTMSLAEAAEAHRLQEANTLENEGTLSGKIVIVP
ncbi:NADPH:quinone reductase [Stratiformator vulcanicus]|uniref:Quinone oxidoreductase 1 n=1 Tax=Stratiformator vulcanicus TaxID=2527980 RepID=A0A517QX15_9PLAN|nr:NADPH:quinone reductase [Stratiformator vulcanicus]QDT36206.1 Quinone oxidoreductase 1 [Stratiformator vulcanicus]